ncbi:hypothetical protein EYC58_03565 [Candidatus Saccharibacteria bacterium]|nr:MAG: hypothetical protein EYC58_03565 [Candidatus Saccharibacteria bacterium]
MREHFVHMGEWLKMRRHKIGAALAGTTLALTGCTVSADRSPSSPATPDPTRDTIGECEPYTVFAQNRWAPQGAAVRAEPYIASDKVGSLGGNEVTTVDGWKRDKPAYPTNPDPWKGEIWLRLQNRDLYKDGGDNVVWVNSAAVRAEPTAFDPTSRDPDGGKPAPIPAECELK